MCYSLDKRISITFKLSNGHHGTSKELMMHYELEEKLKDIIRSKNLGSWIHNDVEHGFFLSIFRCDDPDATAKAIEPELKKFKLKTGLYIDVDKHYEETQVFHETI